MITPKQKAKELVEKFKLNVLDYEGNGINEYKAKQCALIAVEEIIDLNLGLSNCDENNWSIEKFYIEVKQEIEKL
jgi:hypothetical protein